MKRLEISDRVLASGHWDPLGSQRALGAGEGEKFCAQTAFCGRIALGCAHIGAIPIDRSCHDRACFYDQYARVNGYTTMPAILDGDVCVMICQHWVATAQYIEASWDS